MFGIVLDYYCAGCMVVYWCNIVYYVLLLFISLEFAIYMFHCRRLWGLWYCL